MHKTKKALSKSPSTSLSYDLNSVFDNQKASKNTFQATPFKVEENSRTFQGLAQKFKDLSRKKWNPRTFQDCVNPAVPQMSFCYETNRGVTKCWLFPQANLTPFELQNWNEQGRTGLSKVAGCLRQSPPTWLVSAGYSTWHLNKISLDRLLTLTTQFYFFLLLQATPGTSPVLQAQGWGIV